MSMFLPSILLFFLSDVLGRGPLMVPIPTWSSTLMDGMDKGRRHERLLATRLVICLVGLNG